MSQVHEVSIVIDTYPHTRAIKEGGLSSPSVKLNFTEYKPISKAFDVMLQDQPYDVCEMALGTFLQALDAGKPIKLLPIVMGGEFHHGSLWYNPALGPLSPSDLKGKRVGVRAYTQTTGLWVRGVLQEQFGVPSSEVIWVTTEAPHVAEYKCPSNVELMEGADLAEMVRSGELAAVIMGSKQGGPQGLEKLIPDVDGAIAQWYEKHHAVPINHMVVVSEKMAPEAVQEVYSLLCKGLELAYPPAGRKEPFALRCGIEGVWSAVELSMRYSFEQGLTSRIFDISEVFHKTFHV
jgi:4,5-dihydroxyphthalate decarboxylase